MEEENKNSFEDSLKDVEDSTSETPTTEEVQSDASAITSEAKVVDENAGSDERNPTNEKPTKPKKDFLKFFKSKMGIAVCAGIVLCGAVAFILINKHHKEKQYEDHLKEFIVEASKSAMASGYICDDLKSIWHDYIFEDKEYFNNTSGTFTSYSWNGDVYCSDFSEAVHKKIAWNKKNLPSEVSESYHYAKILYLSMTPPPAKYKDIHVYVKQMFKAMERLHDLSQDPTGNLSEYSSNCNLAAQEFTSALSDLTNECDIDLSKGGDKEEEEDEFE